MSDYDFRPISQPRPHQLARIINTRGQVITEGQIDQAGKTYIKATIATAIISLVADGIRAIARAILGLACVAGVTGAAIWAAKNGDQIARWLK